MIIGSYFFHSSTLRVHICPFFQARMGKKPPHHTTNPHSPCPKNVILLLQSTPWYQAQTPSNTKCSRIWPGDTPIDHLIKKSHPISHHTPRKKSQKPAQFQKSHISPPLPGFYRAAGYTISLLFRCPSACKSATTS